MKTLELPYICFGRNKNAVTDSYEILEQSPSIPQEVAVLFRDRITKSIQWESSEKTAEYADCFLIWRTDHSGFLFAKLSDGGSDSLKRNHSMQIDAVYLTNAQLSDFAKNKALFFASLCFSSVWEYWEKRRILQPVDENEQNVAKISEKLLEYFSETALPVHSLFLASHQYFTPCGIDRIVYNIHNDQDLLNRKSIPLETKSNNNSISSSEYPLRPSFSPVKYVLFIFIVLLILGIVGTIGIAWYWENTARKYFLLCAEYEQKIFELTTESKRLGNEINTLHDTLYDMKNKTDKLFQEKVSIIEKLENDIKKLKTELQDSRQNADESLKNENELLNTENEKLNKKVNQIRQYIEEIHKIISNSNEPSPEK